MNADVASRSAKRALWLLGGRVALVGLATVLMWFLAFGISREAEFPPSPMLASLSLLPVNLISLWIVVRLLPADGQTPGDLFGAHRGFGLLADIGWGLLWIAVLYIPFVATIIGTMWLLHGPNTFIAFETVFFNPDAASIASPLWVLVLGIVAVITFAPLNAPTEEAVYRGYAQSRLVGVWGIGSSLIVQKQKRLMPITISISS